MQGDKPLCFEKKFFKMIYTVQKYNKTCLEIHGLKSKFKIPQELS